MSVYVQKKFNTENQEIAKNWLSKQSLGIRTKSVTGVALHVCTLETCWGALIGDPSLM